MNKMNNRELLSAIDNVNNNGKRSEIWITSETRAFSSDFIKIKQLGNAGAYGVTYKCVRKSDGLSFAVKFLNKYKFSNGTNKKYEDLYIKSLKNEISNLQKLSGHDNIISLESIYEDKKTLYIVMEECNGGELFQRITSREKYTESDAKYVIKQLLSALRYMHDDKNIIHCDLKPDNILFLDKTEKSKLKIIDYGMSKYLPRLQYGSTMCGTPYYTAPEVIIKNRSYNGLCDMWSVGVILYVMIYGYPPFYVAPQTDSKRERNGVYKKILKGFEPKIKDCKKYGYGPWFPQHIKTSTELKHLISKLLEKNAHRRYTAKEALSHPWFIEENNDHENYMQSIIISRTLQFNKNSPFKLIISSIFGQHFYKKRYQHYKQLRQLFIKYDIDNDEILSYKEFSNMLNSMKYININRRYYKNIYLNLSRKPSVGITFNDLANALVYDYLTCSDQRIKDAFFKLDSNDNGIITIKDLKFMLSQINQTGKYDHDIKLIEKEFAEINGVIDYDEFECQMHPNFESTPEWIPNLFKLE